MQFSLMPRSMIGLGDPVNNDGVTPRPLLEKLRPWVTVHYTGVDVKYGDPGDTEAEILAIQRYAIGAKKSYEYNYVIGQDENPWVYEYAGVHMAAHSAGENREAFGVLMLNGTREPLTDTQVAKFQWLVGVLKAFQNIKPDVMIRKHKEMPGAATACPGLLIEARWADLLKPYTPPTLYKACSTTVQAGENYYSLARRITGQTPAPNQFVIDLQDCNDNKSLHPGDIVKIPGFHNANT